MFGTPAGLSLGVRQRPSAATRDGVNEGVKSGLLRSPRRTVCGRDLVWEFGLDGQIRAVRDVESAQ
jgi:hypothetical protein